MSDFNQNSTAYTQTNSPVLMNITVSDGTPESSILSSPSSFLTPVIISSVVILISLTLLIWASIITRRKENKRKQNQKQFIDAIINRGENIQVKTEIEHNLEEQRNLEILGIIASEKKPIKPMIILEVSFPTRD